MKKEDFFHQFKQDANDWNMRSNWRKMDTRLRRTVHLTRDSYFLPLFRQREMFIFCLILNYFQNSK